VAAPADSADRAGELINEALMLGERFRRSGQRTDLDAAANATRQAAGMASAPAAARVAAAAMEAELFAEHGAWTAAAAAYRQAVMRLPEAAWLGTDRASQLIQLSRWPGLASTAAAAALRAGDAAGAVTMLEEGRSIRWSRLLDLRTTQRRLHAAHPARAARLDEIRTALDAADDVAERTLPPPGPAMA
jgi:hypothetical protein